MGCMLHSMKILLACLLPAVAGAAAESFEAVPPGPLTSLASAAGHWSAMPGHASVLGNRGHSGTHSLRLGEHGEAQILLDLAAPAVAGASLSCFAERWTKRPPFGFRIEAQGGDGGWQLIHRAAPDAVRVGGFLTHLQVALPAGTRELRFACDSGEDGGILLDDVMISEPGPLRAVAVSTSQPVCPVMLRAGFNPVLGVCISVSGSEGTLQLEGVELGLEGSTRPADIERVELFAGSSAPSETPTERVAEVLRPGGKVSVVCKRELVAGDNWFWVSTVLRADADIDGRIAASLVRVKVGGGVLVPAVAALAGSQRIGVAVKLPGDDGSKGFRIPGLVRTKQGSLLAVYDVRYRHLGDLPADIDVGVSRSPDGGRTWHPLRLALDMGKDPKFGFDGVGDPCVLVDEVSGRIWIAASWSHGKLGWNGSKPGLAPEQTQQLMVTWSDDDGRSWSPPRNLTKELKQPGWRLFMQGPGAGITLRDGTLVMPAQYRAADGPPDQGKPFTPLIWSADRGVSWHVGSGVKSDTTEAQVAELADGALMLNCRDNRGGARTVAVTRDRGQTWTLHPTDRKALREPVCMASLLRWQHPLHGDLMFFSNPDTTAGRHHMTVKLSRDQALTWPESQARLYDSRPGCGYSCLAIADASHLGVLYEGNGSILFLRLPLSEWFP